MPETPTRPRIVARHPDDHAPSDIDSEEELPYFAFQTPDRMKAIKDKIEEREKVYLDLDLVVTMLEGNPEPGDCQKAKPTPDGSPYPCQCGECELGRVTKMRTAVRYSIGRLRALYSRLA